jgi:hypothetical protein
MRSDILLWILISSVLIFAVGIATIGYVNGQVATIGTSSTALSNNTQFIPVYLPPPIQPQETVQEVAQQTDTNSIITVASLLFTGTIAPFIIKLMRAKNESQQEHDQNVFRLKATSSAIKEQNKSLQETDKGDLEQAVIIQKFMKMFHDYPKMKEMMDKITVKGVPIMQAQDNFVSDSRNDLEDYYSRNDLPEDEFDVCNDPIVKQVTAVRNKSRK